LYQIDQFRRATNFYPRLTFSTTNAPTVLTTTATNNTTGINSADSTRLNSLFNDLMGVVGTVQKVFYSNGKDFPSADQELKFLQRSREYNFFFQDDWRVTKNLTLNLGVRYEYNSVPFDLSGMQVVADKPLNSRAGDVSLLPAGPGTDRMWYKNDLNNFAPAVGFAWTPRGDHKTSIRGGYRTAYNRLGELGAERGRAESAGHHAHQHYSSELCNHGGESRPRCAPATPRFRRW
jgi:outer membrane receptor protein involved in Fe transport